MQVATIEFDPDTYEPLTVYKPKASRTQIEKALSMLNEAERPLITAGGGIINADASDLLVRFAEIVGAPVIPTLMGWGSIPDDHPQMDYCVRLAFDNINSPEVNGYGVDHVGVVEGLGCKAIRVFRPEGIRPALEQARELMKKHGVPVVVEIILERVTNIAMGTEIDAINEFDDVLDVK